MCLVGHAKLQIYRLATNELMLSAFQDINVLLTQEVQNLAKGDGSSSEHFFSKTRFVTVDETGDYGWHNAAKPMLVVTLGGEIEVESSGLPKVRRFGPGTVILVEENPEGAGHRTRIVGNQAWNALFLELDSEALRTLRYQNCESTA